MGNSGSSGGGNSRKARSLPNSPEAHRYLDIPFAELTDIAGIKQDRDTIKN